MTDTPPLEPLGLDEVKLNLRLGKAATEDDLLEGLIVDAREFVERETGLVLVPRLVTETAKQFGRWIDLSSWPVRSIVEIRCPFSGFLVPLSPTAWRTCYKRRPVRILPTAPSWGVPSSCAPSAALPVEIDVQAGYAAPAEVPRAATRAMHMLIAHWYSNRAAADVGIRAAAIEVPFSVTSLLRQLKLPKI